MLTKLPRHTRNMDKSDNSETWTSAGERAWVGGGTPPTSPWGGRGGQASHQPAADPGTSRPLHASISSPLKWETKKPPCVVSVG